MNEYPDFYVFGLTDGEGSIHREICSDSSDTIYIEGILPDSHPANPGETFYFESDAYHLEEWAKENGMTPFKHGYLWSDLGEPAFP